MVDSQRPGETGELSPDAIFEDWIVRHEAGGGGHDDIEGLCSVHPHAAGRLRALHRQYVEIERLRRPPGSAQSEQRHAPEAEAEPHVEIDEEGGGEFLDRLLERLAGRGASSSRLEARNEVARGGGGTVFRVYDADLRRHLAMKVAHDVAVPTSCEGTASEPRRRIARFLEEAQVSSQLDHPGIVPVHELGLDAAGRAFFTMKLVKGRTLKAVFELARTGQEGWTQIKVLGVLLKVCEAMSYAHDKGVIHRDLKPSNVMVGRFGEVYVMDWGCARVLSRADHRDIRPRPAHSATVSGVETDRREHAGDTSRSPLLTMDGHVIGTPAYMPPEQAKGDLDAVGPPSDVYAVGAMLYHLLAGHEPYVSPESKPSHYLVLRWVCEGPPRPLLHAAPDASAELVAICEKAMARDPAARYPDMKALAADLSAYLEIRPVAAYGAGTLAETHKWVERNRALALSMAATICVLLGASMFLLDYARRMAAALQEVKQKDAEISTLSESLGSTQASLQEAEELAKREAQIKEEAQRDADSARIDAEAAKLAALQREQEAKVLKESLDSALSAGKEARERAEREVRNKDQARHDAETAQREVEEARRRAEEAARRADEANAQAASLTQLAQEKERQAQDNTQRAESVEALYRQLQSETVARERSLRVRGLIRDLAAFESSSANSAEDAAKGRPVHVWWREEARRLLEGRAEDESTPGSWEPGLADAEKQLAELRAHALDSGDATSPRAWRFKTSDLDWWHEQLEKLVADLQLLRQRLELVEQSVATPEAERAWQETIAAIASSPRYGGVQLQPQVGLLPLGPDPASGLSEFVLLQSGAAPSRGADQRLVLTPDTGIVLVLLPGGTFRMGAQNVPPQESNDSERADADEGLVHEVSLRPFFLSKYEVTVAQWLRVAAATPRELEGANPLLPVIDVSWNDCVAALARLDARVTLPTEAQWEYACRAGRDTPWWTGADVALLRGLENVSIGPGAAADLLPVGRLAPNPLGLFDLHGNVAEWCLDGWGNGGHDGAQAVDPLGNWQDAAYRVIRGGDSRTDALEARASSRLRRPPGARTGAPRAGVRPARAITP